MIARDCALRVLVASLLQKRSVPSSTSCSPPDPILGATSTLLRQSTKTQVRLHTSVFPSTSARILLVTRTPLSNIHLAVTRPIVAVHCRCVSSRSPYLRFLPGRVCFRWSWAVPVCCAVQEPHQPSPTSARSVAAWICRCISKKLLLLQIELVTEAHCILCQHNPYSRDTIHDLSLSTTSNSPSPDHSICTSSSAHNSPRTFPTSESRHHIANFIIHTDIFFSRLQGREHITRRRCSVDSHVPFPSSGYGSGPSLLDLIVFSPLVCRHLPAVDTRHRSQDGLWYEHRGEGGQGPE